MGGSGPPAATDDDVTQKTTSDSIETNVFAGIVIYLVLSVIFDLLRRRLWWVYEPRLHHEAYKPKTPAAPSARFFGWAAAVMKHWDDDDFLHYAGVDGLVMIYFLRYAVNQFLFSSVVGLLVLVPTYYSDDALSSNVADGMSYSFSLTTVENVGCDLDETNVVLAEGADGGYLMFPRCKAGGNWRFVLIVCAAWLFTLRALSQLSYTCKDFVRLRHRYLTSKMTASAPPVEMQHVMTALVENVPPALRSTAALKRTFEQLCGPGSVHSAQVMVADIGTLDALCRRRDAAIEALIEAHSRRAKMLGAVLDQSLRDIDDRGRQTLAAARRRSNDNLAVNADAAAPTPPTADDDGPWWQHYEHITAMGDAALKDEAPDAPGGAAAADVQLDLDAQLADRSALAALANQSTAALAALAALAVPDAPADTAPAGDAAAARALDDEAVDNAAVDDATVIVPMHPPDAPRPSLNRRRSSSGISMPGSAVAPGVASSPLARPSLQRRATSGSIGVGDGARPGFTRRASSRHMSSRHIVLDEGKWDAFTLARGRSVKISKVSADLEAAIVVADRLRTAPQPQPQPRAGLYERLCGAPKRATLRRAESTARAVPHHLVGSPLPCACLHGYSKFFDGHYVASIPFYEQLARELNAAVLREHFVKMAALSALPFVKRADAATKARRKRRNVRRRRYGFVWAVDDSSSDDAHGSESDDETPPPDECLTSVERRRQRRGKRDAWRQATDDDDHVLRILAAHGPVRAGAVLLRRLRELAVGAAEAPQRVRAGTGFVVEFFERYVLCGHRCTALQRLYEGTAKRLGPRGARRTFQPSSTAFVTFTRPTARVLATNALLSAKPFGIEASLAPEPRDVIWANVHENQRAVMKRSWIVDLAILLLLVFWTTVVTACSNAAKIVNALGGKSASEGALGGALVDTLPVILLLSIINLLPLCFQAIARFYERRKAFSAVDLSVVERFQKFQLVNVYVSILSSALLAQIQRSWRSPYYLLKSIGTNTPSASVYFAKLVLFQASTSPMWLMRAWPLISRGPKTWTIQPPELPGMMYGWAYPKVMMTFLIASTFWVFAPILSVIACVYFVMIQFAFRYLILYVHMPVYESGGLFFYHVVTYICFGLFSSNLILVFWLLTKSLVGYALLVAPLCMVVRSFRHFAYEAYERPSMSVALDEAVEHEAWYKRQAQRAKAKAADSKAADAKAPVDGKADDTAAPSPVADTAFCCDVTARFDATLYRQPSLRPQGTLDADSELALLLVVDGAAAPAREPDGARGAAEHGALASQVRNAKAAVESLQEQRRRAREALASPHSTRKSSLFSQDDDSEVAARHAASRFARLRGKGPAEATREEREAVEAALGKFYRGETDITGVVDAADDDAGEDEGDDERKTTDSVSLEYDERSPVDHV